MRIISPLDFGSIAKGRRLDLGWTQQRLADEARVSRKWVTEFERGKPKAEMVLILAVFEALDLEINASVAPGSQLHMPAREKPLDEGSTQ